MPEIATTALVWLAAVVGAYVFLFWIAAWWARRTPNDIDDVVVGVLQKPVVLGLITWAVSDLTARSGLPPLAQDAIQRAASLFLIGVITWGVWRLMRDTVLYYGRQLARRTESSFDDVLIPVLDVLAPVVVIGTGAILMLRLLGADISTVVLTAGGAALIVGLSLGDTLRNILGGLMLLVDTPFRFGDLIILDGVVCEIKHIGLRVTTLYNTEEHSDIFIPNSVLAGLRLNNITRPSPDLRVAVDVAISDSNKIPAAKALLHDVADANPYVLGDLRRKLAAMKRHLAGAEPGTPLARELRWGLSALRHEQTVDRRLASILGLLDRILATIRGTEQGGLTAQELAAIATQMEELDACDERFKAAMRAWAKARTRDPQLVRHPRDRARLLEEADMRLQAYEQHLAALRRLLKQPDLYEMQRIDDQVCQLRDWLPQSCKPVTPAWKYPFVSVAQIGAGGASLRLYVYVDDIHLERFVRRARVVTALREAAAARLQELANPSP